MKISIIVEGKTEKAFMKYLRNYLTRHLEGRMPKIDPFPYDGRIPTGEKLKRVVNNLLTSASPSDYVIALTDVYTGTQPPDFNDAQDAKQKMRSWVGAETRFHPHVALYDFEAWLLPYWNYIQKLAGHNQNAPAANPETVNHNMPPSKRIQAIFKRGGRRAYVKARDVHNILRENDLSLAISQCSELKAFVNTILTVCGGKTIP